MHAAPRNPVTDFLVQPYRACHALGHSISTDCDLSTFLQDFAQQLHGVIPFATAQAEMVERRTIGTAFAQAVAALQQRMEERTAALRHAMAECQRLEQAAQRAEHLALLGRLAAGVSHEIRNPLAALFLHVDVLEEELRTPSPDSPAAVAEALAAMKTNLARLNDLVQNYLTCAA